MQKENTNRDNEIKDLRMLLRINDLVNEDKHNKIINDIRVLSMLLGISFGILIPLLIFVIYRLS